MFAGDIRVKTEQQRMEAAAPVAVNKVKHQAEHVVEQ